MDRTDGHLHLEVCVTNENMIRVCRNEVWIKRGMNKTLPVCCQVVQTFPGLSIISSLLSCRCFSLDFQLSLLVARLPTDVWLPTPSHQLWLWWSRALLLWITALKFPLSCHFLCPPVTSAARGKLHVSHLPLCLSLFLKHTLSCLLCAPPPPSLSLRGAIFSERH